MTKQVREFYQELVRTLNHNAVWMSGGATFQIDKEKKCFYVLEKASDEESLALCGIRDQFDRICKDLPAATGYTVIETS